MLTSDKPACPLCSSSQFEKLQQIDQELARLTSIIKNSQKLSLLGIREASNIIDRIHELREKRGEILTKL